MDLDTKEKTKTRTITDLEQEEEAQLIVFNDDFNTFDHVIRCFIEICEHTFEDASKLAFIIHNIGSTIVKSGAFEEMKRMKEQLVDCGLSAIVQRGNLN